MDTSKETLVANHYGITDLGEKILDAARETGLDLDKLRPADLAPVDEFHMGGRAATAHVIGLMDLTPGAQVLDIGSGLGGVVRFLAAETKCKATGIDLTPEFVDVAKMLTDMTGLTGSAAFHVGSALDLPFADASFDAATTFHVAMNIANRPRFYAEAARVIRPGGHFAIFDVMKGPNDAFIYPVPWAETAETSYLTTPAEMSTLLAASGFEVIHTENRTMLALEHHRARLVEQSPGTKRPALGLHILQGESASLKSKNMIQMLKAENIVLVGMVARRVSPS